MNLGKIIMKKLWLKITLLVVLIAGVIVGVYTLWPAKSSDTKQDNTVSKAQLQAKRQLDPKDFQMSANSKSEHPDPREEEHRQTAALLTTIYRNPYDPQAKNAREILLKRPEGLQEQYSPTVTKKRFDFLNVPQDSNQPDAPIGQEPSQHQVGPKNEEVKGLSNSILQEHIRQYRANRNEMFPSYQGSSQSQKSGDLVRWLPLRYRRLFNKNQQGLGFPYGQTTETKVPGDSGLRNSQWNFRELKSVDEKTNIRSFNSFQSESIKKQSVSISKQNSESADNAADKKKNVSD